jgi:uncharacterized integral membrane protein
MKDDATIGDLAEPGGDPSKPSPEIEKPEKIERVLREQLSVFMRQCFQVDPFVEKLTDKHVSQIISDRESENKRKHHRYFALLGTGAGVVLLILVFVVSLCWLFLDFAKPELLAPILSAVGGLIAGGLGGFGLGRATAKHAHDDE